MKKRSNKIKIEYVEIGRLEPADYNPRRWTKEQKEQLQKSLESFDFVEPLVVNSADNRKNIVIGGHFRLEIAKKLGYKKVPVVFVNISDESKEKELNLRLNKNTGEWDVSLLAEFDESFLSEIGFSSEELDDIFDIDIEPEIFNLEKELEKLEIYGVKVQKGDIYQLGNHKLMCGDSTVEKDILKLVDGEKSDMSFTDPPYLLDYLHGKKKQGKATEGFGYKRDRKYLETDELPPDFTEKWMANINKVQKENFSIIVFENWKNLRVIWNEMEKYWQVRNMIVWYLPNRHQGFATKYKFFSKHDIAMVGSKGEIELNLKEETEFLQNEYETALYAISGKPHWENYRRGKKIQPTDFIEFRASDEKHSQQGIVFGTKPVEILIPYIKVLTKRGDLIIEPFGGSGSTLIAAEKMKRKCFVMEISPVYCEVIKKRWENLTGQKAKKLS